MLEYVVLENGDKIGVCLFIDLWATGNLKALSSEPQWVVSLTNRPSWDYLGAAELLRMGLGERGLTGTGRGSIL